jgi:hypothetical protein
MAMTCVNRSGKLRFLRINDLDNASGAPGGAIHEAVTAVLVDDDEGYAFELHDNDPDLPSRQAMLTTLRDAFYHGRPVGLSIELPEGETRGQLRSVKMH